MKNKKFINLFFFYSLYIWFTSFSGSILPTHFLSEGLNLSQMIFGKFLFYIGNIILLLLLTTFRSKRAWRLALFLNFGYILLSIKILSSTQFYAASILSGFALFFFYVFYNIAHFENTPQEKRGYSSALMFSIGPLIGIAAPLASGYLAATNINLLWIFSGIFFLVTLYFINRQEDFSLTYSLKSALREIKATRWFIFLEGIWEAMIFGIIPIFSLFFIKKPLEYGGFLAYLAIVAVLANLILGKLTDKIQKRVVFLYPLTIGMSVLTFLFVFAVKNFLLWAIFTGLLQFLLPLFWNVSTAMVIDSHPNLRLAIPGREFMLAAGRIIGLLIAFISFSIEKIPHNVFFVLGFVMFLYPVILFWNTRISKRYRYL
ncbi:MAG: MFS transporter [Candidatus Moranbacteria bacterium]|nr:MFS transporter [Candidatus Moranbacteria bacterium]